MRTVPPDLQSDNRRDYPPDLRVVVACAVLRPEARRIRVRDSSSFGNCQKKGSSPQLLRLTPPKGLNPGGPTSFAWRIPPAFSGRATLGAFLRSCRSTMDIPSIRAEP